MRLYESCYRTRKRIEFCEATFIGLAVEPKKSCTGARRSETCVVPRRVDASRFSLNEQRVVGGGGRGGVGLGEGHCLTFSFVVSELSSRPQTGFAIV